MKTSKTMRRLAHSRGAFAGAALLVGTIAFCSANAADVEGITVSAPKVKIVAHGPGTAAAAEEVTISARVQYDPVTLTTRSGVALLKDGVEQAARRICQAADPGAPQDNRCVRDATHSAQPQIDAAVARAHAREHG